MLPQCSGAGDIRLSTTCNILVLLLILACVLVCFRLYYISQYVPGGMHTTTSTAYALGVALRKGAFTCFAACRMTGSDNMQSQYYEK